MRAIIFICLLLAVFCQEAHFFHYHHGHMKINHEQPVRVSGPIFIEFLKTINITSIAGMHIRGSTETPFALAAKITHMHHQHDKFEITAQCVEGAWGTSLTKMEGHVIIIGTLNEIHYHGNCHNPENTTHWHIEANAHATKCPFYSLHESARRASILVGQSDELYHPVHVINYATIGYPYIRTIHNCTWYLNNFKEASDSQAGLVIVGKDGAHCGIVDREGDKFIHANPVKGEITDTPLSMANNFFKNGYVFKDYSC